MSHPVITSRLDASLDAAEIDVEKGYLARINREFAALCKDRFYVLGNHCVDTLTKEEFLGGVEQEKSYTSFDRGGWPEIVLAGENLVGARAVGRLRDSRLGDSGEREQRDEQQRTCDGRELLHGQSRDQVDVVERVIGHGIYASVLVCAAMWPGAVHGR